MTIADTSVWVEFLRNREPVHARLKSLLERGEVHGVECVFGELFSGARGARESAVLESYWASVPKVDEAGIWIEAGKLDSSRHLHARASGWSMPPSSPSPPARAHRSGPLTGGCVTQPRDRRISRARSCQDP